MSGPDPRFFTTSILPVRRGLVLRGGGAVRVPLRVRVGYFHHPQLGHTLIDTGYARHVTENGGDRYLELYRFLLRPTLVDDAPLERGLARLGVRIGDVETVIVSHFHADHIGGLRDLPGVRVLCSGTAWQAARQGSRAIRGIHGVFPTLLPDDVAARLAFVEEKRATGDPERFALTDDGAVVAVSLPGHLDGQIGVLFPRADPPFLYASDVQWSRDAILQDRLPGFPADRIHRDRRATVRSAETVRRFAEGGGDFLLCHDWHLHPRDIDPDIPSGAE